MPGSQVLEADLETVRFTRPPTAYLSERWRPELGWVTLKRAKRGITCTVKLRAESAEVGVRIRAAPRKALRLDLSIQQPGRIQVLVVVGFDAQRVPQLRWDWDFAAAVLGSER